MKKITSLLLVLFPIVAISQTVTQNYIKTTTYKVPTQTAIVAPALTQANQSVSYFDGLGRLVQQIAVQQSASGKDIVTPIEYDDFGRQVKDYLPYASSQNSGGYINPATLVTSLTAQYQANYGASNDNPYSRKELESSPLNRVLKQAAPGDDWRLNGGHEIKFEYQSNTASEVINFGVSLTFAENTYTPTLTKSNANNGFYAENQLYKTITYDENTAASPLEGDGSTVEFKNKEGQVVLKRTYGTVGAGTSKEKHDTYYVYDVYGNLTFVIPPKAVDLVGATTATQADVNSTALVGTGTSLHLTASNSIQLLPGFHAQAGSTFSAKIVSGGNSALDDLCYQYKYDHRNRLVEKKLPGKQWEFIVYDKLDRVVATGPALSPFTDITSQGWTVTKYDSFSRPVITAWLSAAAVTSASRKTLQDTQNALTANFSETKSGADTTINGVSFRYSNTAWPIADYHVLTVSYFDDYNYTNAPAIPATVEGQAVYYNNTTKPIGLATGSWIRVLEASTAYRNELAYTFYDTKARPIRTYSQNFLGGYTYTDSNLDAFSGQLQYSITRHKRLAGDAELTTKDAFTYSPQDRLLTQTHQINGGAIEVIASNAYDELGQLISKEVGGNTQKIDYTYNIRGWLTAINDITDLTKTSQQINKDLFAFKINYNNPNSGISGVNPLYNGNIAETYWSTNSDGGTVRSYGYRYDNLNRLKDAVFKNGVTITNTYNEALTYDKNGNIASLKRNGINGAIDDLVYHYAYSNTANVLMKVVDNIPSTDGFKDSPSNAVDDYGYDANGNMIKDNNKNIIEIKYNHLNLPTKITFASNENIVYLYNATGQKLQKTVNRAGQSATITDYLGGYQYESNALKFFPTVEGYVEPVGSSYKYIYQYKDHLGNIRLSYDKVLIVQEENNYYPFGLKHQGNTPEPVISTNDALKYKYNGKELQEELGLNVYDMDARQYDPAIGRWGVIDPQAELLERSSPYVYALNSPLIYVDKDGELPILINGKTTSDSERADVSYWTASIVNTIKNSGIANPGGQVHYVDGNRGYSWSGKSGGYASKEDNALPASRRAQGGRYAADGDWKTILSKLARDPETGKIIEKIQIYTHSRGAAFGVGYTERLLELIKENSNQFADAGNVIDFVYNMAPHQSDFLTAPKGVDSYSMDHDRDKLSDNDMKGLKGAFTSGEKSSGFFGAHSITSFSKDLKGFTSAFLKGGTSKNVINNFIKTMKEKYGVTVTVEQ